MVLWALSGKLMFLTASRVNPYFWSPECFLWNDDKLGRWCSWQDARKCPMIWPHGVYNPKCSASCSSSVHFSMASLWPRHGSFDKNRSIWLVVVRNKCWLRSWVLLCHLGQSPKQDLLCTKTFWNWSLRIFTATLLLITEFISTKIFCTLIWIHMEEETFPALNSMPEGPLSVTQSLLWTVLYTVHLQMLHNPVDAPFLDFFSNDEHNVFWAQESLLTQPSVLKIGKRVFSSCRCCKRYTRANI